MKIGDEVRIVKCEACPKVVGKTAKVVGITTPACSDVDAVKVKFGKGRPPLNRPTVFSFDDVVLFNSIDAMPSSENQLDGHNI